MPPMQSVNGHFYRTTWVNRHQKGKPFWILLEMTRWQWHHGWSFSWWFYCNILHHQFADFAFSYLTLLVGRASSL